MKPRFILTCILTLSLIPLTSHAMVPVTCFFQEFVRGTGPPIAETHVFTIASLDGTGQLIIHNGGSDKKTRVSSAEIWFNGNLIFGPSDFNKNVEHLLAEIPLAEDNEISVKLNGKPGSYLTAQIIKEEDTYTAVVGPGGGIFEFSNSVILDIPPGAIDREVEITIEDLPYTEVDSILQSYGLIQKYFAGGFEGQPDGLNFNVPITVTIPVEARESSGDLPLLFLVNLANGTYTLANTELRYDPMASTVTAKIRHFTDWAVAFGDDIAQNVDCNSPDFNVSCKCKTITVYDVTEDTDVAGECFVKKVVGTVIFEDCPGDPEQSWTLREWERPDITITPNPVDLTSCTTSVTATVTNAEGEEIPNAWINWDTDSSDIWLSSTTGKTVDVTVPSWVGEGLIGTLEARTGCDTYEVASVRVSRPPDFILQIKKNRDFIYSCQEMELRAEAFDTCEDATGQISGAAIPVRWDIFEGSDVVEKRNEIDPNGLVVRGLKSGFARIRATAINKEEVFADITVEVRDPTVEIVPGEDFVLNIGDSKELDVLCTACPENVSWRTDNPGVAVLTDLGGDTVRVTANAPGTANVFAETADHCGEQIGDLLTVTVTAPGYTLTWNLTLAGSMSSTNSSQNITDFQFQDIQAFWSGSAVVDFNQNVTSASSSGYWNEFYHHLVTYHDCGRYLDYQTNTIFTISDGGPASLDGLLRINLQSGPNGAYIPDPLVSLFMGGGWTYLPALVSRQTDSEGYSGCGSHVEFNEYHTIEEWESQFPFYFLAGDLYPDDLSGLSFSKQVQGSITSGGPPLEATWNVRVVINP